jgi:PAS domain S-box-containing protein
MEFSDTERQAILAAIINSSDDAIISKDLNSVVTSWNKSAERIFGYTANEMIGRHISILIPADRQHEEEMIIENLKAGNRIEHFETVRITKSGQKLDISLTVSPIKNVAGLVIGASKIARDITRQKKDEEVIRQYTQRLELINSAARAISSQLDINEILQKVTDISTQLAGAAFGAFFYNKTDRNGESYMLYALSGAPREAFEKFGMPRNTEVFKTTFDGKGIIRSGDITKDPRYGKNLPHHGMPEGHLPVTSYMAIPVKSQSGVVIGGLFLGHPKQNVFTEDHEHLVVSVAGQAAVALDNAKLYQEIRSLNSKKDEFIGFASHELKTPLTTLSGYIQLARQMPEPPPAFLEKMDKQVKRLNIIINDLLDISKIQAGKLDIHFTKTSLYSLIRESIEALATANRMIETELPAEDIEIIVDSQKMSQVLVNLLSNAIKYSDPATEISVTAIRIGDEIKISTLDHGMGIPSNNLQQVFTQFYRVARSSHKQGTGLGLYIAKEIIDAHSGRIWVESEEGKGSVFHVRFPIEPGKSE